MLFIFVLLSLLTLISSQPDYDYGPDGPGGHRGGGGPMGPWGPRGFGRGPPRGGFDGPWGGDGPPPWERHHHHHHHRPPWARGGPRGRPWDFDGPPPPWRRGPGRFRGPPPPDYDFQQEEEAPPPPPPAPTPQLPPIIPQAIQMIQELITSPLLKKVVQSIEQFSDVFRAPGQSYSNVLKVLDKFYKSQGGDNFDMNKVSLVDGPAGTELGPNRRVAGALFEIDMILTVAQANRIASNRRRRMLVARAAQRWATTINYRYADDDVEWRARISQVLKAFEDNTCLRFREQTSTTGDHIVFARGDGCMSALGRLGGAQLVSIGYGCEQMGIIAHEMGHALGFWHEHSRPDRDSFLRVNTQNMQQGTQGQFVKRSIQDADTQSLPFDYASVMHYAANSYAKKSTDFTLEPTDVLYRSTIGSRSEPSFLDYKHINKLYCSKSCRPLACQNGGYVDPNNCNQCKCPHGLGGTLCDKVQESVCGMELIASGQWRNISFSGSSKCYWRVKSPARNLHVEFELTHVWFTCAPACNEYVELKWHDDLSLAGGRLCCKPEGGLRVTESDTLVVIAKPLKSSQFTLRYRIQGGVEPIKRPRETEWTSEPPPQPPEPPIEQEQPGPVNHEWTLWSEWSECGERCGACGRKLRTRACNGQEGSCPGEAEEKQLCNFNVCQEGMTLSKRSIDQDSLVSHIRRKRSWCCEGHTLSGDLCVSKYQG